MFHSGSAVETKECILESLAEENGVCRVVICTCALGMGVNVKGPTTVLHYVPTHTLDEYLQEYGRAGRDGRPSQANLLWNRSLSRNCSVEMKKYLCTNDICYRSMIMTYFGVDKSRCDIGHHCCDVCQNLCICADEERKRACIDTLPYLVTTSPDSERMKRRVIKPKRIELRESLLELDAVSEQKELYAFHITSLISNAEHIITHQDIQFFVPVKFNASHAKNILRVFTEIFGDTVSDSECTYEESTT